MPLRTVHLYSAPLGNEQNKTFVLNGMDSKLLLISIQSWLLLGTPWLAQACQQPTNVAQGRPGHPLSSSQGAGWGSREPLGAPGLRFPLAVPGVTLLCHDDVCSEYPAPCPKCLTPGCPAEGLCMIKHRAGRTWEIQGVHSCWQVTHLPDESRAVAVTCVCWAGRNQCHVSAAPGLRVFRLKPSSGSASVSDVEWEPLC